MFSRDSTGLRPRIGLGAERFRRLGRRLDSSGSLRYGLRIVVNARPAYRIERRASFAWTGSDDGQRKAMRYVAAIQGTMVRE